MENQGNQNFIHNAQEIDLVDLIAVLWRRHVIVIGVAFLCLAVGLVLFMPKSKSTISTVVMLGKIPIIVDGNVMLQRIMSPDESKKILKSVYFPQAISKVAQGDDQLFKLLLENITVNDGDDSISGFVLISSSVIDLHTEIVKTILHSATAQLLELQNRTYKTHQDQIQNNIVARELELKIQTDERRVESERLTLKNELFLNAQLVDKNINEELHMQQELRFQRFVSAAQKNLVSATGSLKREIAALQRHKELIPILETRLQKLKEDLEQVRKSRNKIFDQATGVGGASTMVTQAMLVIDGRDSRYRKEIDTLNERILVDLPLSRIAIENRLRELDESVLIAEQSIAIATEDLAVFRVEKEYTREKLESSTNSIEARTAAFEAAFEAEVSKLEAAIVSLQLSLAQSTPSEILAAPTVTPFKKTSVIIIGLGVLFVGGMLGCFVAFLLELLAQAKVRVSESA